jgi:protein-disulfide isomerase
MKRILALTVICLTSLAVIPQANAQASAQVNAPVATNTAPSVDTSAKAKLLKLGPTDFYLGNKNAKITLIEYSSLSCPHCADFHKKVFPELKKLYIDNNKILFIHRDFPLNPSALHGAVLARCDGSDRQYFRFLKALFNSQDKWAFSGDYMSKLKMTGKLAGISEERFNECMKDEKLEKQILQSRQKGSDILKISSTPSFLLNGEKIVGSSDLESFKKAIDAELAKK